MSTRFGFFLALILFSISGVALAADTGQFAVSLVSHAVGYVAIVIFILAYLLVMAEEFTHLRKSKPVILAAGIIWAMIAAVYSGMGDSHTVEKAVRHNVLEFAELMLFLLVAMTYINVLEERKVFELIKYPKYLPAYERFTLMENGWLFVVVDSMRGAAKSIDIFNERGEYLARFETDVPTERLFFNNGKAYSIAYVKDYPYIKRYGFQILGYDDDPS